MAFKAEEPYPQGLSGRFAPAWHKHQEGIILTIILIVGAFLRLYHLGYQSLWFDELHTAIESDPSLREHGLFHYLRTVEQQPPLFFWLEQLSILVFGNSECSVRLVPALAGIGGIAAIYMLGKEIKGSALGLYAAGFMCINAFCIHFSQEARPYTLIILFSILSWIAFVRFIRQLNLRHALWYVLFTVLMLYTNYFGLLVFASQMLVGCMILWVDMPDSKRKWALWLALSGGLVLLAFTPLLPLIKTVAGLQKFWAPTPEEHTGIRFFYDFFGASDLLKPFLQLFIVSFFLHLFLQLKGSDKNIRTNPLTLLFVLCGIWIFFALLVPFVKSWLQVPMMVLRYSATLVTAFILLLAAGLEAVASKLVRHLLLAMFVTLSATHIFIVKDYYHAITKQQFRELAAIMSEDSTFKKLPLITGATAWHQAYYLGKFQFAGKVHSTNLDSSEVLAAIRSEDAGGFWLAGGHIDNKPKSELNRSFDSAYLQLTDAGLNTAWAQLFVSRNLLGANPLFVDLKSFPRDNRYMENDVEILGVWNANPVTASINLEAGKYRCIVVAYGSAVKNQCPNLHCGINKRDLGARVLWPFPHARVYDFSLPAGGPVALSFWIDNDAANVAKGEDRNASINRIILVHTE